MTQRTIFGLQVPRSKGFIVLRRLLFDPFTLFFAAAALIFGAYLALQTRSDQTVVLDQEVRAALIDNFEGITGRTITAEEIKRIERDYIIDELIFREAIDRGMHLTDSQTKTHLTNNLRRILVGTLPQPSEADLVNFYAENIEDYRSEPTLSFRQVFFDTQPEDPAAILTALNKGDAVEGAPYWMGNDFQNYGESMVRGVFGTSFLGDLATLPDGKWAGIIETERGYHAIFKSASKAGELVPFAKIRDQIEQDYWAQQTRSSLDSAVETLAEKYDVVISVAP